MKITDIKPQKYKKRVNIYVDDKFAFGLSEELRFKYSLNIGDDIDDEFVQDILLAEELTKAINYALRLLTFRQRSEEELIRSLKRKGFDEFYVEKTIEYCKENNYINDTEFTRSFIQDKVNLNNYGSDRIKNELLNKGVSKDIIEKELDIDEEFEYECATKLALKRLKSYEGQDYNAIYRKLGSFLQRKGYSYDIVSRVLRNVLNQR